VHFNFENNKRSVIDHWLFKRKLGCKPDICQFMDLWGGTSPKVEALYYANVTVVVNVKNTGPGD
jgi:hypothetical protein